MEHYFTNNENLSSKERTLAYNYKGVYFSFVSDRGVFAKNKIDFGSRLLVETFLSSEDIDINSILDVGCGYGYIGTVLGKILGLPVAMLDINEKAINLARVNIENNKVKGNVFVSDVYDKVKDKYDLIITNPPIRAGKEVVLKILRGAKEHLQDSGQLWFVIRKDQGAKSVIKCLDDVYKVAIIKKNNGFFVFKAQIS